jgi:dCMP deaminase
MTIYNVHASTLYNLEQLRALTLAAHGAKQNSNDPFVQIGCAGYDCSGQSIVPGWNGFNNQKMPVDWTRDQRRPFVIHAEMKMLEHLGGGELESVYVSLLPCVDCMRNMSLFGLQEVFYSEQYERDLSALEVAKFYNITCHRVTESGIIRTA